jgi:hypothetical protein
MANEMQIVTLPPDGTKEAVALSLLNLVARSEGKIFDKGRTGGEVADRKWILNTYAECLTAIQSPNVRSA